MISVAIDIDGVLANNFSLYKQIAEEEGVTGTFDNKYNGLWKVYTKDNKVFGNVLFDKHRHRLIEDVKPIDGALEGYEKFVRSDRIVPYIVTARDVKFRDQTKQWLEDNGFTHYQDLLFYKNKLHAPTQVIIDDRPLTIKDYVNNARMGLLRNQSYNQQCKIGRRVSDLEDAYNQILPYIT